MSHIETSELEIWCLVSIRSRFLQKGIPKEELLLRNVFPDVWSFTKWTLALCFIKPCTKLHSRHNSSSLKELKRIISKIVIGIIIDATCRHILVIIVLRQGFAPLRRWRRDIRNAVITRLMDDIISRKEVLFSANIGPYYANSKSPWIFSVSHASKDFIRSKRNVLIVTMYIQIY